MENIDQNKRKLRNGRHSQVFILLFYCSASSRVFISQYRDIRDCLIFLLQNIFDIFLNKPFLYSLCMVGHGSQPISSCVISHTTILKIEIGLMIKREDLWLKYISLDVSTWQLKLPNQLARGNPPRRENFFVYISHVNGWGSKSNLPRKVMLLENIFEDFSWPNKFPLQNKLFKFVMNS